MISRIPTAPIAATGLIAGFGVAIASGSRALGGAVMAGFGLTCIYIWSRRDGNRTAAHLTLVGLGAFIVSHGLGLLIGAWPSVLIVSAVTAYYCWRWSDHKLFSSVAGPLASN